MDVLTDISFENTVIAFEHKSDQELRKAYYLFKLLDKPKLSRWASKLASAMIGLPFVQTITKKTIFKHFCAGETIAECLETVDHLDEYNVKSILDYSVEGENNEAGFDATMDETIRTIEMAGESEHIPFAAFKPSGVISIGILEKIQKGDPLTEEEDRLLAIGKERFKKICRVASEKNVPVLIDAEDSWYQDTVDQIVYDLMQEFNTTFTIVYNTYQMYRKKSLDNLRKAHNQSVMNNYFLGAKLVRGAYMEKERERAKEHDYDDPIQESKEATDEAYDEALKFCINNKQKVCLFSGTHNEDSSKYLALLMDKHGMNPNDPRVYFSQLYGMSDHISFNLAKLGYNVVKYVPYGPVKAVIPYLTRRAEENSSVAGQSSREFKLISAELKRRKANR